MLDVNKRIPMMAYTSPKPNPATEDGPCSSSTDEDSMTTSTEGIDMVTPRYDHQAWFELDNWTCR